MLSFTVAFASSNHELQAIDHFYLTAAQGFEPRLPRPERGVLPLDETARMSQSRRAVDSASSWPKLELFETNDPATISLVALETSDNSANREEEKRSPHETQ